ncbi:cytochrome P450 [Hypoxylon trugodes]|uniref:cytochrome P450 n=1 Tax=Hypoxylon trugodes TaxID=326681 RepID=UPI00218CD798|nr:cytochrome P450 [Hypoxylon trugodes]KAI1390655.1 cytochrome P450 [Hypoxylon trugodes]
MLGMSTLELLSAIGRQGCYLIIGLFLLLCSYRILLHPLRGYPGPFLAKVTAFYAGFYVVKKSLHLKMLENHRRYGSVVRLGPDRLVFNTVTAFRVIYQSDQSVKSYTYQSTTKDFPVNMFTERDHASHLAKRKLIEQAITEKSMRSFGPDMVRQINTYLKQVIEASRTPTPVNITEKARHLALDIVGQLAFGQNLHVQTSQENRFIMDAMSFGHYRLNIYHHMYFLSKIEPTRIINYITSRYRQKYWLLLQTMIKTRMGEERNARPDFYSFVSDTLEAEPDTLRGGSMWTEALFFMSAGGDTVATLTCAIFFYLSRNPECYSTLAHEIRSTFFSGHDIQGGPQLADCVYLRACIDESLRMSPPSPSNHWREQDPDDTKPLMIDGNVIPRGTLISVSPYALQHNEAYFPDSFAFKPERWLDTPGKEEARKIAYDAFGAFSIGPRNCAGKAMAYLEASLVVAKTLWYFDFEPAPGKLGQIGGGVSGAKDGRDRLDEYQLFDIFTSRHDGPYLIFRPQGDVSDKGLGGNCVTVPG